MTAHATSTPARGVFGSILAAARNVGAFLIDNSDAMRCRREAERLFALSDAELAKLGLTRDRIIHHAFARYLAN